MPSTSAVPTTPPTTPPAMAPTCLLSLLDGAVFAVVVADVPNIAVADVLRLAVSTPFVGEDTFEDGGWPWQLSMLK